MLNLHCQNNDKKMIKKLFYYRDSNPGYMGSKSTEIFTTIQRPTELTDKNNQYMLKF